MGITTLLLAATLLCTPTHRSLCTEGVCAVIPNSTRITINLAESEYYRCAAEGNPCTNYVVSLVRAGGDVTVASPKDGLIARVSADGAFSEVLSSDRDVVVVSFGHCSAVGGADPR